MADDFILKWDADNERLYGEDPDDGSEVDVPFKDIDAESVSADRVDSGIYERSGTYADQWEVVEHKFEDIGEDGIQLSIPDRADVVELEWYFDVTTTVEKGPLLLTFDDDDGSHYWTTYLDGSSVEHDTDRSNIYLGIHDNNVSPSGTMRWNTTSSQSRHVPIISASADGEAIIACGAQTGQDYSTMETTVEMFSDSGDLEGGFVTMRILDASDYDSEV